MNRYFLAAKAVVSIVICCYLPEWIPFVIAYWAGVAFIYWRGKRGLPRPGELRVAVEYLGGYPGLTPPQTVWLKGDGEGLVSGGLKIPYAAMRKLRVLSSKDGLGLARAQGLTSTASHPADLFLALLWRDGGGTERELVCRLPEGKGERRLRWLYANLEAARVKAAQVRGAGRTG